MDGITVEVQGISFEVMGDKVWPTQLGEDDPRFLIAHVLHGDSVADIKFLLSETTMDLIQSLVDEAVQKEWDDEAWDRQHEEDVYQTEQSMRDAA